MSETKDIADGLRDLLNWIAVFEEEYMLPAEVCDQLRANVSQIAQVVQALPLHSPAEGRKPAYGGV